MCMCVRECRCRCRRMRARVSPPSSSAVIRRTCCVWARRRPIKTRAVSIARRRVPLAVCCRSRESQRCRRKGLMLSTNKGPDGTHSHAAGIDGPAWALALFQCPPSWMPAHPTRLQHTHDSPRCDTTGGGGATMSNNKAAHARHTLTRVRRPCPTRQKRERP